MLNQKMQIPSDNRPTVQEPI